MTDIDWLVRIEDMAHSLYKGASEAGIGPEDFQAFLNHLSADELQHSHLMRRADEYLGKSQASLDIGLSDEFKDSVEQTFRENLELLSSGNLTFDRMLKAIATTEVSEWNDYFLYVVDTLREKDYDFSYSVAKLQSHIRYIEQQFEKIPEAHAYLKTIKNLTPVWKERVLVVDNFESILNMFKSIFKLQYAVDASKSATDALQMMAQTYYDAIVTDIDLWDMDGIRFYTTAALKYPDMEKRFLFFASAPDPEKRRFIERHKLKFLARPATIEKIRSRVDGITQQRVKQHGEG